MTAERYLMQIKKIDAIIVNKLKDHRRWVELAEGLGGFSVGEKVQSSRNLHSGADAIGRYIDIEREIDELKLKRLAIIADIERLPPEEYEIIYKLFVEDRTLKEIAYEKRRSYEWVKVRKRRGLDILQRLIDKKEG